MILNTSVNGDTATASVRAAVGYAGERGAIIVASAGNDAATSTCCRPTSPR
jgi:hypothetical protein